MLQALPGGLLLMVEIARGRHASYLKEEVAIASPRLVLRVRLYSAQTSVNSNPMHARLTPKHFIGMKGAKRNSETVKKKNVVRRGQVLLRRGSRNQGEVFATLCRMKSRK